MFGLPILDVLVIAVYFVGVLGVGFWAMFRIKNSEDFFLGGRRFGKLLQISASFGQATSVSNAVSAVTTTMENGIAGIWSSLLYVFGTPVFWLTTIWYRRLRIMTMGDFFENRYGSKIMAGVYSVISVVGLMIIISLSFNAMGKTALAMMPKTFDELSPQERIEYNASAELSELESADYLLLTEQQKSRLNELRLERPRNIFPHISKEIVVLVVCIITLIYTIAGGLEAAFVTDLFQGLLKILLSIMLLPFAWMKINSLYGGKGFMDCMRTLHVELPESFFEVMGSPSAIDFT
jgi:solute:Na+ symporter, SSS family